MERHVAADHATRREDGALGARPDEHALPLRDAYRTFLATTTLAALFIGAVVGFIL